MKLSNVWFLARKDIQYLLFKKETILWTFVMPVIFFYFFGTIMSGFSSTSQGQDQLALIGSEPESFLTRQLVHRLEQQDFEVIRVSGEAAAAEYPKRLLAPSNLTANLLALEPSTIEFTNTSDGLTASYDDLRVQRAVYMLLADVVALSTDGETPTPAVLDALNATPRNLTLDVSQAGEPRKIPSGFDQAVPGTMVMFTLLVLLTSGTATLVNERKLGLLRRLASAPLSRGEIVAGKALGRLGLASVQIGFAMGAGSLLFGITWGRSLPMVLLVMASYAALVASLAVLLGSLATTEGQAAGLGVLTSNVLAALGGCWWPIEITPGWMQALSRVTPTGNAMSALHQLTSFGSGAGSVVPHVTAFALATLAVGWLAARAFRFS